MGRMDVTERNFFSLLVLCDDVDIRGFMYGVRVFVLSILFPPLN